MFCVITHLLFSKNKRYFTRKLHIVLFNKVYLFVCRIPLQTHTYLFFSGKKELTNFSKAIALGQLSL